MGEGRILYVHPSKLPVDKPCDWSNGESPYLLAPMGIIGLANALRTRGLDVVGINYPMEVALDQSFRLVPWLRQQDDGGTVMTNLPWSRPRYGEVGVMR